MASSYNVPELSVDVGGSGVVVVVSSSALQWKKTIRKYNFMPVIEFQTRSKNGGQFEQVLRLHERGFK